MKHPHKKLALAVLFAIAILGWTPQSQGAEVTYSSYTATGASDTSWVIPSGFTSVAAINYGGDTTGFGGVTWQDGTAGGGGQWTTGNTTLPGGLQSNYSIPNVMWGNNVNAFYAGGPDLLHAGSYVNPGDGTSEIYIGGLTVGTHYAIQFVVADNRTHPDIVGRTFALSPVLGVTGSFAPTQFAYGDDRFLVVTADFVADNAEFKVSPAIANSLSEARGGMINGVHILQVSEPSANGSWISTAGGNWSTPSNWLSDGIANGPDSIATFSAGTGSESITVTLDSNRTIGNLAFSNANYTLTGANTLTLDDSGTPAISVGTGLTATIGSNLAGNDGITKTGEGTLTLSVANSYTGATTINGGTLALQNSYASSAFTIMSGAVLELNVASGSRDYATATFSGAGTLRKTGGGEAFWGSGAGTFTLGAGSLIDVQEGTFAVGSSANENMSGSLADLNIAAGATFNSAACDAYVNALTGAGTVFLAYTNFYGRTMTVGVDNGGGTFSGTINDSSIGAAGNGILIKTGTGTQILTGTNTYSGTTTISGGTLRLSGNGTLGTGDLTVASGATCDIQAATGAVADTAAIHLNGTGMLSIAAGVVESVGALYIDGVPQPAGSYSSANHPSLITGGGSLAVTGRVILTKPVSRQIVQRDGSGTGALVIQGTFEGSPDRIEARAVVMAGTGNNGTDTAWTTIATSPLGGTFSGTLAGIAAGGWYQIEVRMVTGGVPAPNAGIVQRVGVGDVYLTAGQSNAANYGTPGTNTDDRVSAMDYASGAWTLAADPMPGATGWAGHGSVWTRLGSRLTAATGIPVGFVCTGIGATWLLDWVPPASQGYVKLKAAAQAFPANGFRAVLWHQGESDSGNSTTPADYQARLQSIISQLRTDAGWAMPWYVSEASFVPSASPLTNLTVEEPVVAGQRRVIYADPLVFAGPVTDDFHLEGKCHDGIHFNDAGMIDFAQQWADLLTGNAPLAPKNGDIESNTALAEGGIAVIDTSSYLSPSVISWRTLAASGEAVADGSNGYFNPGTSYYGSAADDSGPSGGVLPNMSGRHAAFFYGGTDGNHFLQTRRATLLAHTTYTLTVALGVRGNGNMFGNARIELLADGLVVATRDVSLADLNAMNGGNAANTFTDVQVACTTGATVTAGQQVSIRITKVNGLVGGNATYLDFDSVRLTAAAANDFNAWISNPDFGLSAVDQGFMSDPDGDRLPNGIEAWFGTHPGEPNPGITAITSNGTSTTFTHPQNGNPPENLSGFYQWSPDLAHWYAADGIDGPPAGATVTTSSSTAGATTTVTANSSEPLPRLFLRAEVVLVP